jgi:tRNA (cytidine/uridine-2'-O-)-methyltransferase
MSTLNVVLVHPLIPQNTGSIARLTASTNVDLHLIEPLGFELSDRYLKRAGLDYWPEVKLFTHARWECFLEATHARAEQLWLLTKKADRSYHRASFSSGDYLVFGSETTGIPLELHECYAAQCLRIPMDNPNVRSLNLANAVGIVLYEARRQLGLLG